MAESEPKQILDAEIALSDDLLRGAEEIAKFLYGNKRDRRKVYNLAENCRLPHFRLGSMLCARKSRLKEWIIDQEDRSLSKESD